MCKDITVLVNSCDRYEDAWNPFFTLFKKYWTDCPYKIYLNTETKSYSYPGLDIECLNVLNSKKKYTWSKRLIDCLKRINSKYIVFLLEDFFFLDYVKSGILDKTKVWLDQNEDVSCFQFYPNVKLVSYDDGCFPGFLRRDMKGKWWLRCQAAIWRRSDLLQYLNPYENVWQYEEYGTNMAKLYNKRFYNAADTDSIPFFYNVDITSGYGLYEGQWLESNKALFEKENISVDFEKMGTWENGASKAFVCYPSRKTFRERWMYFLYGGGEVPYMSIKNQFKFCIVHPLKGLKVLCKKILFVFTRKYGKSR